MRSLKQLSASEKTAHLRNLGRTDLYFLLRYILKAWYADNEWCFQRCREVQAKPNGYLDLWAREHFKSTIITFALTIQDILNDPEITVGIFSHTRPIAKGFLRQIKREFENNETLKALYPDVLYANPSKESPKWGEDDGIIVRRHGNPKESTVEAWGVVDGQPTSKHFKRLVYDDLVTKESVTSPEMIEKTTNSLALSYNLGSDDGERRFIGTRYHYNDSYKTLLERLTAIPRLYPATDDGTVDGEPVLLTREKLAKKRADMGPYVFGCLAATMQILMADWSLKPIHAVEVGDIVVGWTMEPGKRSKLVPSKVLATQNHRADTVDMVMAGGLRINCTPDHRWWSGRRKEDGGREVYLRAGVGKRGGLSSLCRILDISNNRWPSGPNVVESAAYLAGIFDGEGSICSKTLHIAQCERTNPKVCARIRQSLVALGFDFNEFRPKRNPNQIDFCIRGGRQEIFRFLTLCDPAKRDQVARTMFGGRRFGKGTREPISSIAPGERQMVYNIETETGNYVANGYASKNCQMLQNPSADSTMGFKEEWLKYYPAPIQPSQSTGMRKLLLCDPANEKKATSDYTSIWILGLNYDGKIYALDIVRDRLNLTERTDLLFSMHRRWQPQQTGIERYGMQSDIAHIKAEMERRIYHFDITELGGPMPKNDRIRRLIPKFEQGVIMMPDRLVRTNYERKPEDLVQIFINDEFLAFPVAVHDDMLDALARMEDETIRLDFPQEFDAEEDDDRSMAVSGAGGYG